MKLPFLLLCTAASLPLSGICQVTYFQTQKNTAYTQTKNDTAPTVPVFFSLFCSVTTSAAGDANSFTVSAVDKDTLTTTDGTNFYGSIGYNTRQLLDAGFPVGDAYTFTAVGGTLNGESGHLPIQADAYPQIPYLTGTSFTQASEITPNTSITLHFARHGKFVHISQTALGIFSTGNSATTYYFATAAASATSFKIPASVVASLTPGVTYVGQVEVFNQKVVKSTGSFTSASNDDGFVTITTFPVKVK
jgi:hypothetical protein